MASIDSIVARLTALHPKRIDLSLGRIQRLLALDHRKKIAAVIHVAGTNGKGSTIAFLRAILEASGKRVYIYTSCIWCFNERFRIGAREVSWLGTKSWRQPGGVRAPMPVHYYRIQLRPPQFVCCSAPSGGCAVDGSRSWRPAGRHECGR